MDLSFANPAGLWGLLGLPAVLAIHFLQRRSKLQTITTLFLLEQRRRESETGHRFERLRSSVPLWLQLMMVLGLTWLLVQPRWRREESVQRVAVVLDASASMQAGRDRALRELESRLMGLAAATATTEYSFLSSAPEAPAFYHGTDVSEGLGALKEWRPWLGSHDVTPALRSARSLVGHEGIVLFLTDHLPGHDLPYAARHLAIGESLENCGFAGVTIEERDGQPVFKALVRNFGSAVQSRDWWIEAAGQKTPAASIDIPAGQSRTLQAAFPSGTTRCKVVLSVDRFAADDELPLVRPEPKILSVALPAGDTASAAAFREVFAAFPRLQTAAAAEADLLVTSYDPLAPALPQTNACVFAGDPQPGAKYAVGLMLAEAGPLMDGLNWQSLLVRETLGIPRSKDDRVVLWQGERPLIAERHTQGGPRQLLFNFDLQSSNARKLPAFAILLHRFIERLREEKISPESINVETNQRLRVAHATGTGSPALIFTREATTTTEVPGVATSTVVADSALLRAPVVPGFFVVAQDGRPLLTAAAHFLDPRESDFTTATSGDTLAGLENTLVERHSEVDANWRLWTLLLVAALITSWWFTRDRSEPVERGLTADRAPPAGP